jgi:hypothetical protein
MSGATDPFDYIESRADADELIDDFGQLGSIRRTTNSGTVWEPTPTTADYDTFVVQQDFTQKQIATWEVLATDTRWFIAAGPLVALSIEPIVGDSLVVAGSVVGTILQRDVINPGGVPVYYDCQLRI